jgi:chorismate mutase
MPDTSDDLITIREEDLVESLTMAMHAEHLDDHTVNSVLATLLDAICNNCD